MADTQFKRLPKINEGKFITVELEEGYKVKLLTPIEDSICSCKSSEICKHKAQAILYYKAYKDSLDINTDNKTVSAVINYKAVEEFSYRIEEEISHILAVGLSRISHSQIEHLEKLSLSSHNAGLARHENIFRELSAMLQGYFLRDVHFSESLFLKKLCQCYFLARKLREDRENISKYMGVFREEYIDSKDLTLIPLGDRYIETDSGYAGNGYYFLEEESGQVYSYSDLRPTFYDKGTRGGYNQQGPIWNLDCSIATVMDYKLTLRNPKISSDRRISTSNQIVGELGDKLSEGLPISSDNITYDYRTLITLKDQCENDKVAIIMAERVEGYGIDKIKGVFVLTITDINGYPIDIQLKDTKANEKVIRILSAFGQEPVNDTIFIGIVYPESGRLKMAPIEYYSNFTPVDKPQN